MSVHDECFANDCVASYSCCIEDFCLPVPSWFESSDPAQLALLHMLAHHWKKHRQDALGNIIESPVCPRSRDEYYHTAEICADVDSPEFGSLFRTDLRIRCGCPVKVFDIPEDYRQCFRLGLDGWEDHKKESVKAAAEKNGRKMKRTLSEASLEVNLSQDGRESKRQCVCESDTEGVEVPPASNELSEISSEGDTTDEEDEVDEIVEYISSRSFEAEK
ncbi:hypothetical protein VNI00_016017 [Paramarasmius palmivorus]|uniref:Uncharacterized protein n=1 Tax=Paramarasmius palmivorus TaxID=297713 RepID=A0AAW0BGT6_9AGAR